MKKGDIFTSLEKGIVLKDVNFMYPNTNNLILENINLEICKGEKIAIVGDNGSTLIKCILGLYSISKGDILVDNKNINSINLDSYWKKISVVFQDYMKFHFSFKENIGFGELNSLGDIKKIKLAAQNSGMSTFIEQLPEKYDTTLGQYLKEGIDLSGGQWQRLAISRAIIKNSDILIFDEPTAALDPLNELDIMNKLSEMLNGKTGIIISHRLATTRFVDKIIVLKNGKIIEEGKHQDLIEKKGVYYQMYKSQSKWYKDVI